MPEKRMNIAVVGGGYGGLSTAHYLTRLGHQVTVFEKSEDLGGLAGSFRVDNETLEKFYHIWYSHDEDIMGMIRELGEGHNLIFKQVNTGMYYANQFHRLSSPLDLLRFKPLPFIDRLRLGWVILKVRMVRDWKTLEGLTAKEWLEKHCGSKAYRVVWEPLLAGKFGKFADEVSAVWFWNKLVLRGKSRGANGNEVLVYYQGGFHALSRRIACEIEKNGGRILTSVAVDHIAPSGDSVVVHAGVHTGTFDKVVLTPALPQVATMLAGAVDDAYIRQLQRIEYLANACLVLEMTESLSDTYWLNVNDPSFPYVGVIEHTNLAPKETCNNRYVLYLSKYLPHDHEYYGWSDDQILEFSLPHIKRMFPAFQPEWVVRHHVWRERYAQPIVGRHYGSLIPGRCTPVPHVYLLSMAQIYPQDRGTNYAVATARELADDIHHGRI